MSSRIAALITALAACGGGSSDPASFDAGPSEDARVCVGSDVRAGGAHVYYGTSQPAYVPLTAGQVEAIGAWTQSGPGDIFCSGTLIAAHWVLSAAHCGIRVGHTFCMGPDAAQAACVAAAAVYSRPLVTLAGTPTTLDLTLVRLATDATVARPEVQPIPIVDTELTSAIIGQTGETAGYGLTETNNAGTRLFATEQIDALSALQVSVDGMGTQGLCNGDSGGPVLIIDAAATVRVAGALSGGDSTCVDHDHYARIDIARPWIELLTGPTPTPEHPCGGIDAVGRCNGNVAVYCDADQLHSDACAAGTACGWDRELPGFRCIRGVDPCGGLDRIGACDGQVAIWCEDGERRARDCGCQTERCTLDPAVGGAYCVPDPCMGLDYQGRCDGSVAQWCDNGQLAQRDCAADGKVCRYIDDHTGYYCAPP